MAFSRGDGGDNNLVAVRGEARVRSRAQPRSNSGAITGSERARVMDGEARLTASGDAVLAPSSHAKEVATTAAGVGGCGRI